MNLKRIINKLNYFKLILEGRCNVSFSQVGEDRIVKYLFDSLNIKNISYLDIGTNDPINGNNTYLFYTQGNKGVCIEPNPYYISKIKKTRPNDFCIESGIGLGSQTESEYYIYENSGLNTFSKEEVEKRKIEGIDYTSILKLPLIGINQTIKNTINKAPDLLSIDVEGLDIEILKEYDFNQFAPKVIIVETVKLNSTPKSGKIKEIFELIESKGYLVYADTFINTIFCKEDLF